MAHCPGAWVLLEFPFMNAIDQLLSARTVSALSADPPVFAAYDSDFAAHVGELAAFAREKPLVFFLLRLG